MYSVEDKRSRNYTLMDFIQKKQRSGQRNRIKIVLLLFLKIKLTSSLHVNLYLSLSTCETKIFNRFRSQFNLLITCFQFHQLKGQKSMLSIFVNGKKKCYRAGMQIKIVTKIYRLEVCVTNKQCVSTLLKFYDKF